MFHPRAVHSVGVSPVPISVRTSTEVTPPKLCDNGRAYVTDPATGQSVCLCQLGSSLPSPHGGSPHPSLGAHPAFRGLGPLTPTTTSHRTGAITQAEIRALQLGGVSPLAEQNTGLLPPHIAFHPYGAMYAGLDGIAMRKAATRETTGPLKAWLSEHQKNPYPTKAEKIMLAIITRMTLTQVSTWFANARRRLKKDNRLGGGEEGSVDSDRDGDADSVSVDVSVDGDGEAGIPSAGKLSSEGELESFSDISDDESDVFRQQELREEGSSVVLPSSRVPVITSSKETSQSQPEKIPDGVDDVKDGDKSHEKDAGSEKKSKPKIWSISHILDS